MDPLETEQVRRVLREAIAALRVDAARIEQGDEEGTHRLTPRSAGAFPVKVRDYPNGLYVFVADVGASIEIDFPLNLNYGEPNQLWDDDLRELINVVARGGAMVGRAASGIPLCLVLEGSRLGVNTSLTSSAARIERGAPWT